MGNLFAKTNKPEQEKKIKKQYGKYQIGNKSSTNLPSTYSWYDKIEIRNHCLIYHLGLIRNFNCYL